ncbi:hypothetical protein [Luteimicrobium subarcticum]|uniref:Uncharacterized protein n=1 Tax=Luteimicrobium subarcticum TaxID=620910 RepID=A0A2M8W3Q4_9MICO|nr:hypothetical protein [Luteimicrobium subarcticum]PJI85530.1 hypothetical protein CLV34_2710 [Luteimicrobium subarcticum]
MQIRNTTRYAAVGLLVGAFAIGVPTGLAQAAIASPCVNVAPDGTTQASQASESVTPDANCCIPDSYSITSSSTTRVPFTGTGLKIFRDGPGGTLTVSHSYSGTASASTTVGGSVEIGAVWAKAKVEVSGTIVESNSTSDTNTYSHNITSGKYGNVQYVSYGYKVNFKKVHTSTTCSTTTTTGTITYPSTTEGWYYWETSS